jgi:hypothetical protein
MMDAVTADLIRDLAFWGFLAFIIWAMWRYS